MTDLSIIVPTCNRAALLSRCLAGIRDNVQCEYEVIVVDGASGDETPNVLAEARDLMGDRLTVIVENRREGFVRAANKGFHDAVGRCVTWINDDARPLGASLDNAVDQIDRSPSDVAIVAMYHHYDGDRNIAYSKRLDGNPYHLLHVRGTLYANFGVGRRTTWRDLGFFDERYFLNAADPDLSLKAWNAGLLVVPAENSFVDHDEHADARRAQDSIRAQEDNAKLFAKWELPPKNMLRNDFDPANPCRLIGLRPAMAA